MLGGCAAGVAMKRHWLPELEGELVGDPCAARVVGFAAVEHQCMRTSDDRDRGIALLRHRRERRRLGLDDAARPNLLARRRRWQALPEIPTDRRHEPGKAVRLLWCRLESGQITDGRADDLGRHDAADAGPVGVLSAVERAFVMKSVANEPFGQIDDPNAVSLQIFVDVPQ